MAAARKGVYWLDEEVEIMLEALVDMEAGDRVMETHMETISLFDQVAEAMRGGGFRRSAVEYIGGPGEIPHVEEKGETGHHEVASLSAPEGQPTPVVISSAVDSEDAGSRPSTSQQAWQNDLPGGVHRVEALEKGLQWLKTTVDKVRFNVFFIKQGMKTINQTLTEMRLDLALDHQRREDSGNEMEEEDLEWQWILRITKRGMQRRKAHLCNSCLHLLQYHLKNKTLLQIYFAFSFFLIST
ncbi:UNVERIFIED_CONTAM: hypothetical protein K2H54_024813 [Gekko kuhli]